MLTPRFKLTQDENHVFISVHAPYTNIGDTEIDVEGENFLFVSCPYFLRLRLPGKIVDNDRSKGSYVCDSGDFNLTFDKEIPGEYFDNLDMITSLLAPRDIPDVNPNLVEMLEEDGITFDENENMDNGNKFGYGFACQITNDFNNIGNEFPQIFDLKAPEQVPIDERNKLRTEHEDRKFSTDHYLADFFDYELINPYLAGKPFWDSPDYDKDVDFNEDEVGVLKELPNKNYLLSKKEYQQVMCGFVDILFGYCYDKRTTLNESTVESGWTINKLSSTLSWFCVFDDVRDTLIACFRRALAYPIFRNFDLCYKVKDDLVLLLRKEKRIVIKCMIEIYQMFNASNDARYILNQLYIKDYLIFLQKCNNKEFLELALTISNIELSKNDLDLELDEIEAAAEMVRHEEIEILENEVALRMASMSLLPKRTEMNVEDSDEYTTDSGSDSSDSSTDSDSSDSSDDSSDALDSDDDPS